MLVLPIQTYLFFGAHQFCRVFHTLFWLLLPMILELEKAWHGKVLLLPSIQSQLEDCSICLVAHQKGLHVFSTENLIFIYLQQTDYIPEV